MSADPLNCHGANWDEVGADGNATAAELMARIMELATGTRTAVVVIAGLLSGARKYMWAEDSGAADYLQQIDDAVVALASLLPENRTASTLGLDVEGGRGASPGPTTSDHPDYQQEWKP